MLEGAFSLDATHMNTFCIGLNDYPVCDECALTMRNISHISCEVELHIALYRSYSKYSDRQTWAISLAANWQKLIKSTKFTLGNSICKAAYAPPTLTTTFSHPDLASIGLNGTTRFSIKLECTQWFPRNKNDNANKNPKQLHCTGQSTERLFSIRHLALKTSRISV